MPRKPLRIPFSNIHVAVIAMAVASIGIIHAAAAAGPTAREDAKRILDDTGVTGGLIVHLGCGDGRLTAALHAGDGYVVHGLDVDAAAVDAARSHIQSLGLYGVVSVDTFDGEHLPYADELVNLLVAEAPGATPMKECLRVLAPRGVAYVKSGGRWTKTVKPWPKDMDEWTHHLHGPGGNAVGRDRIVGPPAHLRWTAGPRWARSHGWTPSVSAMVSAGGRLFAICDETLTCVDDTVPSQWFVVARDAFSGVLLWKHRIPKWGSEQFSGTPNSGDGVTVGRFTMPPNVGKRLVAVGDTVYVTLGPAAPVTALDAATGEVKRVYAETAGADEILCTGGRLILSINPSRRTLGAAPAKHISAVDAETGRVLWKRGPFSGIRATVGQDPFGRLELAAGDGKVFALTTGTIECLDADSGETLWRIDRPALPPNAVRRVGYAGMYEYLLAVLVYQDDVVLLAQPEPNTHHTYHTMPGSLYAFDAETGRPMWKHAYGAWGHCTPPDVFVAGDVVWTHVYAETEFGSVWGNGFKAKDPSVVDYRIQALELRTGKLRKELSTKQIFNVGHHHRCYRNKSTERFLLSCRRGVEFVDLATGENYQNHWVRGGCLLGYLPCNGLLYVAPHPCQCYINAKLVGFNALAPDTKAASRDVEEGKSLDTEARLEKGPAFGQIDHRRPAADGSGQWPTYRHDGRRSGATESVVSTDLEIGWRAEVGGTPSGVTVADGKVFVADVDAHTVHSLDADTGETLWRYTVGGRVDSPPTFHNGRVIFGSADGRVRCLRAEDGALAWRFDAAPRRRLVTAFGQLESAWPVPGSVLVDDGKCWFAAGRSSYLDGGVRLYALDPATGKLLHRETIYSPDPKTGKMAPDPDAQSMPGLLNDIPATDGAKVFIRQMPVSSSEGDAGPHLFTTGGYLDPTWFNRTFWQAGRARTSGLMVLGDDAAYGMELYGSRSRETAFTPGASAYRLRCLPLQAGAGSSGGAAPSKGQRRQQGPKAVWERHLGIRVTALVRAGDTIFAAGSPDIVDPQDPYGAWEGRKGGVLAAFAAADGEKRAEYQLPAPPVWDGMAAVAGRLFISTVDGAVVCMREAGGGE